MKYSRLIKEELSKWMNSSLEPPPPLLCKIKQNFIKTVTKILMNQRNKYEVHSRISRGFIKQGVLKAGVSSMCKLIEERAPLCKKKIDLSRCYLKLFSSPY